MGNILIKIGIFLLIIILQVALAYALIVYVLPRTNLSFMPNQTQPQEAKTEAQEDSSEIDYVPEYYTDEEMEKKIAEGTHFEVINQTVNPRGSAGMTYVIISLHGIIEGGGKEDLITAKMPAIEDAIRMRIARRTASWILDYENQEFLREELKIVIEKILGPDEKVLRLYIPKLMRS